MTFFELLHRDNNSNARTGVIHTDHGDIQTPIFMPVGTQATVKTLDQADITNLGSQIILGNTYHLHLRPGEDVIAKAGGLHKFMSWNKPILTDSGGFQVFSLGEQKNIKRLIASPEGVAIPWHKDSLNPGITTSVPSSSGLPRDDAKFDQGRLVEIDDDGVTFKSYIDGSEHRFTPESAIAIQHKIGADIIMAFDECTPDTAPEAYVREAMERTHQWAERCLRQHQLSAVIASEERAKQSPSRSANPVSKIRSESQGIATSSRVLGTPRNDTIGYHQFLFGIIQGAGYKHLREESARFISALDFDGIAIGGESIGYNMEATKQILDWVYPLVPEDKPHYAMGVGLSPTDLLIAIDHGVDMFDCVAPTRLARHGMLFTADRNLNYRLNIKNAQYAHDRSPVDSACPCSACTTYSKMYLHHLFAAGEMTGLRLASIHNLHFLLNLMAEARQAIAADDWTNFKKQWAL